jgi:signal transduction histidine kinase
LDKNQSQAVADIKLLQRKIERERKARQSAEQQLEIYSRELYQTNQSLQKSLADTKKKHAELEYRIKASFDVSSDLTWSDMFENIVSLTGKFFKAEYGINVVFDEHKLQIGSKPLIWSADGCWSENPELEAFFYKYLPSVQSSVSPKWFITPIKQGDIVNCQSFRWAVCISFQLENNSLALIGFLTKIEFLDEVALHVLEIAKSHLQSAIKMRLADAIIDRRNIQLQETAIDLEETKKQLIQSEKMSSLGQLAAGVAHEMNNPLGYIRANLQVLDDYLQEFKRIFESIEEKVNLTGSLSKQEFNDIAKIKEMDFLLEDSNLILKTNLRGVERIKEIVDDLRAFSYADTDIHKQISIYDCVNKALRIVANEFKYQHQVINELENTLPRVLGNYGQLQQVFVNLLINSADSMPKGGIIKIYSELDKRHLSIHFKDNGVGMGEKTKKKIFNPFFTTKPVGHGTGLGLSVSYAILESHQVSISVDSELGKGSCFTLRFPID